MAGNTEESNVETELSDLKAKFRKSCKILHNVSDDIACMVTVRLETFPGVSLKFQMPGDYPVSCPSVIVMASNHSNEKIQELSDILNKKSKEFSGKVIVNELINMAANWLAENLDVSDYANAECEQKAQSQIGNKTKQKKKKGKSKNRSSDEEDENRKEKKSSMKTAIDVISRILWDENLPRDFFSIGYIDRFRGIVEKSFGAFSWEDIASVDYDTLAIPKHRIQYFKYKDVIVWDKSKRLDNVFGSTGSGKTIVDVMEKFELEHVNDDEDGDNVDKNFSDDDDDDIIVTIGNDNHELNMNDDDDEEFWMDKLRPNYFIAVRITDPEICSVIHSIQDVIVEQEPRYSECVVPQGALHVTLCTLRLDTTEQIADTARCLQAGKPELDNILSQDFKLKLEGVNNFFKRVLYAKVHYDSSFLRFVDHVKVCLGEAGIEIRDFHEFVPHMTIMKVSRPVSRIMATSDIDPSLYKGLTDTHLGAQSIDSIHLCSMGAHRESDGFYHCATTVKIASNSR